MKTSTLIKIVVRNAFIKAPSKKEFIDAFLIVLASCSHYLTEMECWGFVDYVRILITVRPSTLHYNDLTHALSDPDQYFLYIKLSNIFDEEYSK